MRRRCSLPVSVLVMLSVTLPVDAGVIVQTIDIPWYSNYGIDSFFVGADPGLYFGTVPAGFPNVTIPGGPPGYLLSFSTIPSGLSPGIIFDETTVAIANVPVGTTLTFHEGDLNSIYTYSTLYRDVNGVPTPFEEFRPLIGDGADQFVLDVVGVIDLVSFSFFTGGIYPDPGNPFLPLLVHINVVPEPASVVCLGVGLLLGIRGRRGPIN